MFYVTTLVILGRMLPILQQKMSALVKHLALDLLKGPEELGSRIELCLADTERKSLAVDFKQENSLIKSYETGEMVRLGNYLMSLLALLCLIGVQSSSGPQ